MPGSEFVYIVSLGESMTPSEIKARLLNDSVTVRVCLGDVQSTIEDIRRSYVTADELAVASAGCGAGVYTPGDETPNKHTLARGKAPIGDHAGRTESTLALVKSVVSYIDAHYMEDIGLHTLADYVYLSPSYLGRLFEEETGLSFTNYIINVRMKRAA